MIESALNDPRPTAHGPRQTIPSTVNRQLIIVRPKSRLHIRPALVAAVEAFEGCNDKCDKETTREMIRSHVVFICIDPMQKVALVRPYFFCLAAVTRVRLPSGKTSVADIGPEFRYRGGGIKPNAGRFGLVVQWIFPLICDGCKSKRPPRDCEFFCMVSQ